MSTRRHLWLIAMTSVLAFAVSACSSPKEATPAATPAQSAAPATPAPPAGGAAAYEGFHEMANCQTIYGWAWDKNRPDAPLSLQISDGSTPLATVTANAARKDLVAAGKGNGQHGFFFQVPPALKDGQPHSIRIVVAGDNFPLRGTPKALTCS